MSERPRSPRNVGRYIDRSKLCRSRVEGTGTAQKRDTNAGCASRQLCHLLYRSAELRPSGAVSRSPKAHKRKVIVEMKRDRDVIAEATRHVGEMQDSVAVNRTLIDRTRVLIERLTHLLSGSGRPLA